MSRRGFALCALLGALGLFAALRASAAAPSSAERRSCEALGDGTLRSERLVLRRQGEVPSCADDAFATRTFLTVDDWLARIEPELRPRAVVIELRGALTSPEAKPARSMLLVSESHGASEDSVWLHELAHLRAHGRRPRGDLGARLARAVDEGFADYYAAAISGRALVGGRDLSRPVRISESEWAALALPRFDAHRFGWSLAAELWKREPRAGDLLRDLAACLAGDVLARAESPADVLRALSEECPLRSRPALEDVLLAWAPAELFASPRSGSTP